MNKKIVILGNGNDWCEFSLTDAKNNNNVKVLNSKYLASLNRFELFLAKIHFSHKINKYVSLPFKSFWFKKIKNCISKNSNDDLVIIVYDRSLFANNVSFIKYLRKKFKFCKLIYIFTNIAKYSGASENMFIDKLNYYYDLVYAFDELDSKKYNFKYNPLIYSLNKKNVKENNQVFYVGKAKDRYNMLINCYEKLSDLGIKCNFYIAEVDDNNQLYNDTIKYNNYLTYDQCLEEIQKSSCLLDVIQGDSTGFTIKTCEAIFYNKLLITTNENIKKMSFYDPRYILVIKTANDINSDFFENAGTVEYKIEGKEYFSFDKFIEKVFNDLNE